MRNALVFEYLLLPDGLSRDQRVLIDANGRIHAIEAAGGPPYDARFAIPGMPNAHSHAFQRALAGQGEVPAGEDSFWSWRDAMYRLAGRITAEDLHAVACQAYAEMLAAGFTSVAEFHYLHHHPDGSPGLDMARAIIAAAERTGIRLVLLPVLYLAGGFGEPPRAEQRRFVHASIDAWCDLLGELGEVPRGVAPHSLRAVPPGCLPELLDKASAVLGDAYPVHIHIAEQPAEVEQCRAHHGATPIDVLSRHVELDTRWNLVHATHASDAEREHIRQRDACVVLCPLTEAYLGDGVFPAGAHWRGGGRIAIGTDSNARIDAIEELRVLEYGQRLSDGLRLRIAGAAGCGATLWQAAANGGAAALMQPVGQLVPGAAADIVALDIESGALSGVAPERVLDAWLTGGSRSEVAATWVGGALRARAGRLVNEAGIGAAFAATMRRVWQPEQRA